MSETWLDRKAALTDTQQFSVLDTAALRRALRDSENFDRERDDPREVIAELRAQLQVVEHWARFVRANWPQLVSNEGEHAGIREDEHNPARGPEVRPEISRPPIGRAAVPGVLGADAPGGVYDASDPGAGR